MPPETQPNTLLSLADDMAELSIGSEDTQAQSELPEHDEQSIRHGSRIYNRGQARSATQRDRSPTA